MVGPLEQRQVVQRIAVDADLGKVAPVATKPLQPLADPHHLALAVARRAADGTGDGTALVARQSHRDQVLDAEGSSDRGGTWQHMGTAFANGDTKIFSIS